MDDNELMEAIILHWNLLSEQHVFGVGLAEEALKVGVSSSSFAIFADAAFRLQLKHYGLDWRKHGRQPQQTP